MKKIHTIALSLMSAFVIFTCNLPDSHAQDPCGTAKYNGNAAYFGTGGLFICVSSTIPEAWENVCTCHEDCYYIHLRNNIEPDCPDEISDIEEIRIILNNDSSNSDICVGGAMRQWTEPWDLKYAGTSTNFPTDTCVNWGIDVQKAIDTRPRNNGNNVEANGNHWTTKICGTQNFRIRVKYKSGMPMPLYATFGPFTINNDPCPEFGNSHGWTSIHSSNGTLYAYQSILHADTQNLK
jgi:hypothetical protein